jgi:hypothetical protein
MRPFVATADMEMAVMNVTVLPKHTITKASTKKKKNSQIMLQHTEILLCK